MDKKYVDTLERVSNLVKKNLISVKKVNYFFYVYK